VRALLQRVSSAAVVVDGMQVGSIGPGFLALIGVHRSDTPEAAQQTAEKIANLRVFTDDEGKMNRSVLDIGGEVLVVSQFTLYADAKRGRRPSFVDAAPPDEAEPLVQAVIDTLAARGIGVASGVFGAHMDVSLVNDGPVTILLELP
jgi:D-aminoacyl-tRNA deacylase